MNDISSEIEVFVSSICISILIENSILSNCRKHILGCQLKQSTTIILVALPGLAYILYLSCSHYYLSLE